MTVLGIDTSGKVASCAVMRDDVVLAEQSVYTKLTHSQVTLPLVERIISDAGLNIDGIDVVAVANGPGSYTGLRIGIAMAKGICFGGKKCIGVSTLESLAYNCVAAKARIFAVMAARPGIVYFGAYDSDGETLEVAVEDGVFDIAAVKGFADGCCGDIILTGDAAESLKKDVFSDNENIRLAPPTQRLQRACGVCLAAKKHISEVCEAESLNARYLQITKAEKDLAEGNGVLKRKR